MLFQVMKGLLRSSPVVRRVVTRTAYEAMSRFYRGQDVPFMDFGYAGLEGDGRTLELAPEEEGHRYPIQLYHRVVSGVELRGREVLEVGCGRGGGAAWLARHCAPQRMVGVDVSPAAAAFAAREHAALPNLSFLPGDAEALPFPDGSFDVVVNVESSHCYGSMARFLGEVARVLRPGGFLCYCDIRDRAEAEGLRRLLADDRSGLALLELEEITANVLAALERTSAQKEAAIAGFPRWLRGMFRDQTGVIGGVVHRAFVEGERVYLRARLRRDGQAGGRRNGERRVGGSG